MRTATIPHAIAPRVGALLRMLGSPVDGEALGAARALRRTLSGAGLDMHDLAEAVERPADPVVVLRARPEPKTARRGQQARPSGVDLDYARRRDVVEALRRGLAGGRLSAWEENFATSILCRLSGGHEGLIEKQAETLRRLLAKVREAKAWV